MQISVIGGHEVGKEVWDHAEQVGLYLARRGVIVVCGGLTGVMEATCKGAKDAGGTTVGILPGNNTSDANSYIDIAVCTGMGYTRNALVVKSGASVIAIDGSFGTLSEIAFALAEDTPVIGLGTWQFSTDRASDRSLILQALTPIDAVEKAIAAAEARFGQVSNSN